MLRSRALWFVCASVVLGCNGAVSFAQQTPPIPTFEVASVKVNVSRTGIRGHSFPGDRFEAKNVPLRDLIMIAYGEPGQPLPESEMADGPSWIDSDRFDVSAKVGAESPNSVPQKQLMLRTLLTERFKLVTHVETKDLPVYTLVLAKRDGTLGPQLHRADVVCEALLASQPGRRDSCILYVLPSGVLMLRGQTMGALANAFTRVLDRVVKDRTGLTGGFDADAQFNTETLPAITPLPPEARPTNDAPSFNTAIQEQLGLKLEPTKAPVDVLVIDHAEHPTAN
jgi:uncharacterized protein (TIGR03435 family)